MHLAAYQGYVQIVNMLIEKGASVNRQDSEGDGYAPLHLAAQEGKIDVSRALLQRGAEPNVQNDVGWLTERGMMKLLRTLLRRHVAFRP